MPLLKIGALITVCIVCFERLRITAILAGKDCKMQGLRDSVIGCPGSIR